MTISHTKLQKLTAKYFNDSVSQRLTKSLQILNGNSPDYFQWFFWGSHKNFALVLFGKLEILFNLKISLRQTLYRILAHTVYRETIWLDNGSTNFFILSHSVSHSVTQKNSQYLTSHNTTTCLTTHSTTNHK